MTSSSLGGGGGGLGRPSRRSALGRRLVVVSADPERRTRWAGYFESEGARTMRCAGPEVACALARGLLRCPLLDDADGAVYDAAAVTPEFLIGLVRRYPNLNLAFARDTDQPGGQPIIERVNRRKTSAIDECFGSL